MFTPFCPKEGLLNRQESQVVETTIRHSLMQGVHLGF